MGKSLFGEVKGDKERLARAVGTQHFVYLSSFSPPSFSEKILYVCVGIRSAKSQDVRTQKIWVY